MLQYVMLATDGSAAAQRATDFAAALAARYGARVTVLHTFPPVPDFLGEPTYSQTLDKTLGEAQALVGDVAKRLRAQGITHVDAEVVEGPAASAILDMAASRAPICWWSGRAVRAPGRAWCAAASARRSPKVPRARCWLLSRPAYA
jgi:universal stress protein family protein